MLYPLIHRAVVPATGRKLQICNRWKKNCFKTQHYFSGEEETVHFANWLLQETAVLQYPRLPHVFLCWERYTKQETDSLKTAMDLWHTGKCDWARPIPIWAGSHCRSLRFMTRMTQLITLGYWKELDMDCIGLCFVCVFFTGQLEPH